MITQHGVNAEVGTILPERSIGNLEQIAKTFRIVDVVGTGRRPIRIDVVAQQGTEIAALRDAVLAHGRGHGCLAARGDHAAVQQLIRWRIRKLLDGPLVLDPVLALLGLELLLRHDALVFLLREIVVVIARIAEYQHRQRGGGRTLADRRACR